MANYCTYCGSQLDETCNFCPKCGKPICSAAVVTPKTCSKSSSPTAGFGFVMSILGIVFWFILGGWRYPIKLDIALGFYFFLSFPMGLIGFIRGIRSCTGRVSALSILTIILGGWQLLYATIITFILIFK